MVDLNTDNYVNPDRLTDSTSNFKERSNNTYYNFSLYPFIEENQWLADW
jgi:hypothetical protein